MEDVVLKCLIRKEAFSVSFAVNYIRMSLRSTYPLLLLTLISCGGNQEPTSKVPEKKQANEPAILNYAIVDQLPHDTSSYIEGYEFHNGQLYESAGQYGKSKLMKVDLKTGKALQQNTMEKKYFGEGITVLNGKLFQLTWKEKTCIVYDLATLKSIKTLEYDGEGWGMTNNGKQIIMSNGSNNLYFRDPETFRLMNSIGVNDNNGPVGNINELEYVNGKILANIWQSDVIIKIDPESGRVIGKADFGNIRQQYFPEAQETAEVMNGIAYDSTTKKLFITGKNWPKTFQVTGL